MKAKIVITNISKLLSFSILETLAPKIPLNVFYHIVSDETIPYVLAYHIKSKSEFEKELDFILKKYQPVDLETIVSGTAKSNAIHFSFDDGLKECAEIIAPILLKKGIPATFFINSGFVENNCFFQNYLLAYIKSIKAQTGEERTIEDAAIALSQIKPYMDEDQIKWLNNNGFTIGGHSISHSEFWKLSEEEQFRQIKENMDWIVNKINPKLKVFAFPFTDDGTKSSLFNKIYSEKIVDYSFGTAGYKPDQETRHFQRIPMERQKNEAAANILKSEYLYAIARKIMGVNMVRRD